MTTTRRTKYLEDPSACPYCGYDDFDYMEQDGDTQNLWITWSCGNTECAGSWTEEYTLTNVFLKGHDLD